MIEGLTRSRWSPTIAAAAAPTARKRSLWLSELVQCASRKPRRTLGGRGGDWAAPLNRAGAAAGAAGVNEAARVEYRPTTSNESHKDADAGGEPRTQQNGSTEMSRDAKSNDTSGFFEPSTERAASQQEGRRRGVVGLLGRHSACSPSRRVFITENFFISMNVGFVARAARHADRRRVGKLRLSSFIVFFSSQHLNAEGGAAAGTLGELGRDGTLRRDRDGDLKVGPLEKGTPVEAGRQTCWCGTRRRCRRRQGYGIRRVRRVQVLIEVPRGTTLAAHLDSLAGAMPLLGRWARCSGASAMFDSLGAW